MASIERKEQVINNLISCYHLTKEQAGAIYDNTMNLFHTLCTLTDFSTLLVIDEKMISALVVVLFENINLENRNRFYEQILIFIILSYNAFNPRYLFLQQIGFICQKKNNFIKGTEVLEIVLNELYDYLDKSNIVSSDSCCDLFKSLNTNLRELEQEIKKSGKNNQQEKIKNIQRKFNGYLDQHHITLSSDSDSDDNDDDHE